MRRVVVTGLGAVTPLGVGEFYHYNTLHRIELDPLFPRPLCLSGLAWTATHGTDMGYLLIDASPDFSPQKKLRLHLARWGRSCQPMTA